MTDRPEASVLYVNADSVLESVSHHLEAEAARDIRLVVCDLSTSPHIDLAGLFVAPTPSSAAVVCSLPPWRRERMVTEAGTDSATRARPESDER